MEEIKSNERENLSFWKMDNYTKHTVDNLLFWKMDNSLLMIVENLWFLKMEKIIWIIYGFGKRKILCLEKRKIFHFGK